jgi:hypothetical protein
LAICYASNPELFALAQPLLCVDQITYKNPADLLDMTIDDLKNENCLLFEAISGSRAYGLAVPTSDTDVRGVFVLPRDRFYGLDYVEQVANERNDVVYYELRKFAELLTNNNPNILELLAMPDDCVQYRHPLFDRFRLDDVLSKRCKDTFAGYAFTQIKRARGLNKKINVPVAPARKTPLDFCYVVDKQRSKPVVEWLAERGWTQEQCGLVAIAHMRELYGLYVDPDGQHGFSGIVQKETSNDVSLSSVPKGLEPVAVLSFNKDGYAKHCKDYRQYWDWVEQRNEARYRDTLEHGKNYDAKNMMHTFRLLDMAEEILAEGTLLVRRPNRDELLAIRRGEFLYEELIERAGEKVLRVEAAYERSKLPNMPDRAAIEEALRSVRMEFYGKRFS